MSSCEVRGWCAVLPPLGYRCIKIVRKLQRELLMPQMFCRGEMTALVLEQGSRDGNTSLSYSRFPPKAHCNQSPDLTKWVFFIVVSEERLEIEVIRQ